MGKAGVAQALGNDPYRHPFLLQELYVYSTWSWSLVSLALLGVSLSGGDFVWDSACLFASGTVCFRQPSRHRPFLSTLQCAAVTTVLNTCISISSTMPVDLPYAADAEMSLSYDELEVGFCSYI
jgi:hypothetical protein